jgi:hypothetical protein
LLLAAPMTSPIHNSTPAISDQHSEIPDFSRASRTCWRMEVLLDVGAETHCRGDVSGELDCTDKNEGRCDCVEEFEARWPKGKPSCCCE